MCTQDLPGRGHWPREMSLQRDREPGLLFMVNSSCGLHLLANPDQIKAGINNPYSNYIKKKRLFNNLSK